MDGGCDDGSLMGGRGGVGGGDDGAVHGGGGPHDKGVEEVVPP